MADSKTTKRPDRKANRPETGELGDKIRQARSETPGANAALAMRQREMTGVGKSFRMASEFIAAIIVASVLGLGLDYVFGTRPIFMIVLMVLGFAAGVLNVTRAAKQILAEAPKPDPDKLVPVDDDEDDDY